MPSTKHPIVALKAGVLALALIFATSPAQAACNELNAFYELQAAVPSHERPLKEWVRYQEQLDAALKQSATKIRESYFAGTLSFSSLAECKIGEREQQKLETFLASQFWTDALAKLKASPVVGLRRMAALVEERQSINGNLLFRITGHFDQAGGFHRGRQSLFVNFQSVPPEQWLLIFVHELAHALDSELMKAVEKYSDASIPKALAREASDSPGGLTTTARETYDSWLLAGLDRGFLAEYRAWVVSLNFYRAGQRAGHWGQVAWMDAMTSNESQAIRRAVFNYLDPRFKDPQEGIFQRPLAQELLRALRQKLRQQDPPALGENLERLL